MYCHSSLEKLYFLFSIKKDSDLIYEALLSHRHFTINIIIKILVILRYSTSKSPIKPTTVLNLGGDSRDKNSISVLGRSLGRGNGNPLQYSCLENSVDRRAWWAIVHGITKSRTQLSD